MKRTLDILLALFAIFCFLPFGLIIALFLRLTGEGKIFYRQKRIGKNQEKFGLYKFATMLENSPNIGTGDITLKNDPRILPIGNFLRKTKINEIPQLLNILYGDMSVVGFRPLTPKNFDFYSDEGKQIIAHMNPGLTGVGSIVFRDEENILAKSEKSHIDCYSQDIAPIKEKLEIWYSKNQTFLLDIKLIFLTAWVIVFPNSKLINKMIKVN